MALVKRQKSQSRVKKVATTKAAPKKVAGKATPLQKAVKKGAPSRTMPVIPVAEKPSGLTCPLVLDGLVAPMAFSPRDCFSCDEFDCRFYAAEETSGLLGSRLFVSEEEGDEDVEEAELFGSDRGEDEGDTWGGEEDE